MADAFSILSRELSKTERKLLLTRILSSKDAEARADEGDAEPAPEEPPRWNAETEFSRLTFIRKLVLLIRSFFTGNSVIDLTEDLLIKRTRVRIEERAPGLMDFSAGKFSHGFKTELETLKPAFGFLRSVLAGAVRQREFIAFFTGIRIGSLTERIEAETDPRGIQSEPLLTEERQIRMEMWRRFEGLLDSIAPEDKAAVYHDIQRMQMLESLTSIRLDDAISCFTKPDAGPPFRELESRLLQLSDLMYPARFPPSSAAWNALFLFRAGESLEKSDFDVESAMAGFLGRVNVSMKTVRDFSTRIPLTSILRFMTNDITYEPKGPRGSEEWFVLFKNFWEDRMGDMLDAYTRDRSIRGCIEEAATLFKIAKLPFLENYRREKFGKGFEAGHETSLAIVKGFHEAVFLPHMDRYLKMIAIDGRFFKDENRTAFVDCIEGLAQSYRKIGAFDWRLSEAGDAGKLLRGQTEKSTATEVRLACKEADTEADRIVEGYCISISLLGRMLFGILFGDTESPHDSITNLNTIGGKDNRIIRKALEEAIGHIDRAAALLAGIRGLESA